MMPKTIKFDLKIGSKSVATLADLQDHFGSEIIEHFRSGRLTRWLRVRSMIGELKAVEELSAADHMPGGTSSSLPRATVLRELGRIFKVEAADALRNPGDTFRDGPGLPELVVVPAGEYYMGSMAGATAFRARSHRLMNELISSINVLAAGLGMDGLDEELDEETTDGGNDDDMWFHDVSIGYPLAVGVYTVTFDEWAACVSDGGCGGYRPNGEGWPTHRRPVINVSWADAQMYVEWLSSKTEERYRLLSESEWEYMARAGETDNFWPYWWGADIGRNRACCDGCGSRWDRRQTAPVGSFSANAFGLHDVHGNVQEWVEDCWQLNEVTGDGSAWISPDCSERVTRGGSWADAPDRLEFANRQHWAADARLNQIGFRVARTLKS